MVVKSPVVKSPVVKKWWSKVRWSKVLYSVLVYILSWNGALWLLKITCHVLTNVLGEFWPPFIYNQKVIVGVKAIFLNGGQKSGGQKYGGQKSGGQKSCTHTVNVTFQYELVVGNKVTRKQSRKQCHGKNHFRTDLNLQLGLWHFQCIVW